MVKDHELTLEEKEMITACCKVRINDLRFSYKEATNLQNSATATATMKNAAQEIGKNVSKDLIAKSIGGCGTNRKDPENLQYTGRQSLLPQDQR